MSISPVQEEREGKELPPLPATQGVNEGELALAHALTSPHLTSPHLTPNPRLPMSALALCPPGTACCMHLSPASRSNPTFLLKH